MLTKPQNCRDIAELLNQDPGEFTDLRCCCGCPLSDMSTKDCHKTGKLRNNWSYDICCGAWRELKQTALLKTVKV